MCTSACVLVCVCAPQSLFFCCSFSLSCLSVVLSLHCCRFLPLLTPPWLALAPPALLSFLPVLLPPSLLTLRSPSHYSDSSPTDELSSSSAHMALGENQCPHVSSAALMKVRRLTRRRGEEEKEEEKQMNLQTIKKNCC